MAGLAFGLIAVIRELYSVTNAFLRCGCDIHKSLNYIRAKNRLRLFRKYCEAVWLQYEYESLIEYAKDKNSNTRNSLQNGPIQRRRSRYYEARMRGGGDKFAERHGGDAAIDFAAMEATCMAREASEGYFINQSHQQSDQLDSASNELDFETFENPDDIEVVSGVEADVSYYDHIDSHPQCRITKLGDLHEGICFNITGRILLTCERFSINFLIENSSRDVALHINPRLPQNYIVRNTRVHNVWGREEIATQMPFNLFRGTKFSIQVLLTNDVFMIASNGYHFAEYKHRLPYRTIKAIEVKGDVENVSIKKEEITKFPERQLALTRKIPMNQLRTPFREGEDGDVPDMAFYEKMSTDVVIVKQWRAKIVPRETIATLPLPYIGQFEKGALDHGRAICIKGRVKLLPHSFFINLQDGNNTWPHPDIAFHFNPRFSSHGGATLGKAIICRNAWYNGRWAKEERSELDTNLRPGKIFVLMIRCTKDSFKVYVDRKLITSYKFHIKPTIVNTVYVRGDVELIDVSLLVPHLTTNITENPSDQSVETSFKTTTVEQSESSDQYLTAVESFEERKKESNKGRDEADGESKV